MRLEGGGIDMDIKRSAVFLTITFVFAIYLWLLISLASIYSVPDLYVLREGFIRPAVSLYASSPVQFFSIAAIACILTIWTCSSIQTRRKSRVSSYDERFTPYISEAPIDELEPDILGVSKLVEKLAAGVVVRPGDSGMVFSIEGEWGYGKSSLVNVVSKRIRDEHCGSILLHYNAWRHTNRDGLAESFLYELAYELSQQGKSNEAKHVARLLIDVGSVVNDLFQGRIRSASRAYDLFAGPFADSTLTNSTDQILKRAKRLLAELGLPIVVFIDDTDRLDGKELIELFALLKTISDFPSTSYVLTLDRRSITEQLRRIGIRHPAEYLEKVINVSFQMPFIRPAAIERFFLQKLEQAGLGHPTQHAVDRVDEERIELALHLVAGDAITPRAIIRVVNRLVSTDQFGKSGIYASDQILFAYLIVSFPVN